MDIPDEYVVGIISDVAYDAVFDVDVARQALATLFVAIANAKKEMRVPHMPIVIVSGARDHPLSKLVYQMAHVRGWSYRPGIEWAQPGSSFHLECHTLMQLGNSQGRWCDEQRRAMVRNKRGAMFLICET